MRPSSTEAATWVLLPGLDGSGVLFEPFQRRLPSDARYEVIPYPDRPNWSYEDYADHVEPRLPDHDNLIVIAESFAGPLALILARRRPALRGLILVASFSSCPNPLLAWLPLLPIAALRKLAESKMLLRMFCLGRDANPTVVNTLQLAVRSVPTELLRSRLSLLRSLRRSAIPSPGVVPILSNVPIGIAW